MNKYIVALIFSLLAFACKKHDFKAPEVTLYTPVSNDSVYIADSVHVSFKITDANLTNYKVIISNSISRKIYHSEEGLTNGTDFSMDKKIYIQVSSDTMAYINVLGLDADGNTGRADARFKLKI